VSSLDEISTGYGLLAEAISFPVDFSSVTYRLREQAKWHDGTPVTPDDVIFSFEAVKKYSPELSAYYRHVIKADELRLALRCARRRLRRQDQLSESEIHLKLGR